MERPETDDTTRAKGTAPMSQRTIQQVQQEHTDAWMALPGVIGTAIGRRGNQPCILVLTETGADRISGALPSMVEGYPIVVEHTGNIRALEEP